MAKYDARLPFFTYGFFRPGDISFLIIKEYIRMYSPFEIFGELVLRDGVILAKPDDSFLESPISGYLVEFSKGQEKAAYELISKLESEKLFFWLVKTFNGRSFNILIAKTPRKGNPTSMEESVREVDGIYNPNTYTGWHDPYFSKGLDIVRQASEIEFSWNYEGPFRIQMHYLFLWTIIERFATLRYGFMKPNKRNIAISEDPIFGKALQLFIKRTDEVFSSDDLEKKYRLDPKKPKGSLAYYYQVRSNLTHRGKAIYSDFEKVRQALVELSKIIEYLITQTKLESEKVAAELGIGS